MLKFVLPWSSEVIDTRFPNLIVNGLLNVSRIIGTFLALERKVKKKYWLK